MPKSIGDRQKIRPMSMGELASDMARNITVRDNRYDNLWNYKPFPKLGDPDPNKGFYACPKPIKAIVGGNRSGKSYATTLESVMIYTGIIPPSLQGLYAHEEELRRISSGPHKRPRKVRIIVQSLNHYADTIEPLLIDPKGFLPEAWSNWDAQLHMFKGPDGSFLEIMTIDPREKNQTKTANTIRGADIDHTQIDEISAYPAYSESIARSAAKKDGPKTTSLAYCPQEGYQCWTYETLFLSSYERKGEIHVRKSPERCYIDVFAVQMSMKDNPGITLESYESQRRRYKEWEVAFRVDGEYSDRAENPYFDMDMLIKWEEEERYMKGAPYMVDEVEVDIECGIFNGKLIRLDEREVSPKSIYDEQTYPVWRIFNMPIHDRKYVLSCDISEGNPDSDPHSATVWDATDPLLPFEVAKLHMTLIKPGALAIQCACMANVYGDCLMVPESNNTGGGMFLDRARNYINIYQRLQSGDKDAEEDTMKIGWFTSRHNKGAILENAYGMLARMNRTIKPDIDHNGDQTERSFCPFRSRARIREFGSYNERLERDKDGVAKIVWGARTGANDDTVMDTCIAFRIINHEYDKISACKIDRKVVQVRKNLHRVELQNIENQTRRAFSGMKKQTSLRQRCNQRGFGK